MSNLRFRQIHLDYHIAGDIPDLALDFDPEVFADTLARAQVDSVTCFARDHYGYLYYDSQQFPERIHPQLTHRNLLTEQIAACHARDIRVPIYITVQWDHYNAMRHPEWCSYDHRGKIIGTSPYQPGFYRYLCVNSPYRDWLKAHTLEVLQTLPVDGIFFDILWVYECSCQYCRAGMTAQGLDPAQAADRQAYARTLMQDFTEDMTAFVHRHNPDCSIYYNSGGIAPGYHGHLNAFTHLEFDVLPSASSGGYIAFPVRARFDRTLGKDCMGMTGKFHRGWGDVHTLKNQPALEYECFQLLALNCRCSVGDQLHPLGALEPQTYDLIGRVYKQVAEKEAWCAGAQPLCDIGVLSMEEFGASRNSMVGAVRLLTECGQQFNILDSASDFTPYRVLILPDRISVDDALAAKLEAYAAAGGAVVASFESGLTKTQDRFALEALGVVLRGNGPIAPDGKLARGRLFPSSWDLTEFSDYCEVDYADYLRPCPALAEGLEPIEYAMYTKCVEVETIAEAEVLAEVILPYYYRTWEHFCSHQQAPSSGKIDSAGIVKYGRNLYFAHAIFELYADFAPQWIKAMFRNALQMLLPQPILRFQGPSALETFVNQQAEEQRWVAHLLFYLPERRANKMEIIEDVLPIENIHLSLRKDHPFTSVRLVPEGEQLPVTERDGRIEFTVPRLCGHQMIEIGWGEQ